MLNLQPSIDAIECLVEQDTNSSLTYAALECRLTIERICYDRLRISHDYISHDDLKKWTPHGIVNVLLQEVDKNIATTFTLSISTTPNLEDKEPTKEDYEAMDFVPVGTQIGFDPKRLGKLWNALSNVALHASVPKGKDDPLPQYGDKQKITPKVIDALEEFKRISEGTLISSGMLSTGGNVTFECECGAENKRRDGFLRSGQIISCINPTCRESYDFERRGDESWFSRRTFVVSCNKCSQTQKIPKKMIEKLKTNEHIFFDCAGKGCEEKILIQWRPMQAQTQAHKETTDQI